MPARRLRIAGAVAVGLASILLFFVAPAALAAPGDPIEGTWVYTGEPELLVGITASAGTYTVTALEDTHVANSSCPLPTGTVFETFSEAGSGFIGEAGLWNVATCEFLESASLEYKWEGEKLVGTVAGVCGFGCGPVLIRAAPLVTNTSATAGETSATILGAIDPMRQATSYQVTFDLAGAAFCISPKGAGASRATGAVSLPYADHTLHAIPVEVEGLNPATRYCARIVATNPAGTTEGTVVFFTTSPSLVKPPPPPPSPQPPIVRITSHPPKETADQAAAFAFSGIAGGSYECQVDEGGWRPCMSGDSFGPIQPGDHRFEVRESLSGVTGPADSYSWTIDLPKACILKVARARVFAFTHQDMARLVIHYKAYEPAQGSVSYSLAGTRGSLALGTASTRFKTAGVYRLSEKLGKPATAKLKAASSMKVRFDVPQAPSSCTRYYTKQLTIPKKIFGQTTWFQSDSIFGPKGT
jgi:hypothetical protein